MRDREQFLRQGMSITTAIPQMEKEKPAIRQPEPVEKPNVKHDFFTFLCIVVVVLTILWVFGWFYQS